MIRAFPNNLLVFLKNLFNEVLNKGEIPLSWKKSLVIFIPKSNGKNLRPITLTSAIVKIMEKCIYNRMRWLLEAHFLIPDCQFGFRNFKLCTDNLTILTNHIKKGFARKAYVVGLFLDIAGAFDNVIPEILIGDLENLGIPAGIRKFIHNIMTERLTIFNKNGNITQAFLINKGVPQGSILSPMLFNIYMRGITEYIGADVEILQYADDLVLTCENKNVNGAIAGLNKTLA